MITKTKRASAINVSCPWRAVLPFAADSDAVAERMALAYLYGGIEAEAVVVIGTYGVILNHIDRGRIIDTNKQSRIIDHADRGRIVDQRGT